MDIDLSQLRRNYTKDGLRRKDLREDPFAQFKFWFGQAVEAQLLEPNAMTLASVCSAANPEPRAGRGGSRVRVMAPDLGTASAGIAWRACFSALYALGLGA